MNLKATILLLLVALACAAPCAAHEKKKEPPARPDFSGTWVLDLKKSNYDNQYVSGSPTRSVTLVISHGEPEIKVTRTFALLDGEERTAEFVYYTDGRGEKNEIVGRDRVSLGGTAASESKWKGARLVIRGTEHVKAFGDVTRVDFTEKWELSADGNTLTQTREYDALRNPTSAPDASSVPRSSGDLVVMVPSNSKRVYNRAP